MRKTAPNSPNTRVRKEVQRMITTAWAQRRGGDSEVDGSWEGEGYDGQKEEGDGPPPAGGRVRAAQM